MQNLDKYSYLLTKNRDFQKLFYAKLITFSGDWFLVVPLLGLVYELTNNALITSTVLIVQSAPMVLFSSFGSTNFIKFAKFCPWPQLWHLKNISFLTLYKYALAFVLDF